MKINFVGNLIWCCGSEADAFPSLGTSFARKRISEPPSIRDTNQPSDKTHVRQLFDQKINCADEGIKAYYQTEQDIHSSGKRETIWRGIKLTPEYDIEFIQQTLEV
jgi:hypothetical protein